MKRELSLWTEWAWSEGIADSEPEQIALAHLLLAGLKKRYPHARLGREDFALRELLRDIRKVLRALSYGGRTPTDLHPQRREYLSRQEGFRLSA